MNAGLHIFCLALDGEPEDGDHIIDLRILSDWTLGDLRRALRKEYDPYNNSSVTNNQIKVWVLQQYLDDPIMLPLDLIAMTYNNIPVTKIEARKHIINYLPHPFDSEQAEKIHLIAQLGQISPGNSAQSGLSNAIASAEDAEGHRNKRPRLSVDTSVDAWLLNWHKELWRQGIKHSIYKTTTLTADDYNNICNSLRDDSDKIIQKKRDFLARLAPRELPASSDALHILNSDSDIPAAGNESIQDIFPVQIRYVDLTSLHTSSRIPPLTILRDEYDIMDGIVERSPKKCILVSGTPGIGKTVYLYLRLIRNLLEGKSMFFQDYKGVVYHIGNTIERLPKIFDSSKDYGDIFEALVDADVKSSAPNVSLKGIVGLKIVVTSSPKPHKQLKWMNQDALGYLMTNWEWEEIFITVVFLSQYRIDLKAIEEVTEIVGYNPRICFEVLSTPQGLNYMRSKIRSAVGDIKSLDKLADILKNLRLSYETGNLPHCLFNVVPLDSSRLYTDQVLDVKSTWVMDLLMELVIEHNKEDIRRFHRIISTDETTSTFYGLIWEKWVHLYFKRVTKPFVATLSTLNPAINEPETVEIVLLPNPSEVQEFYNPNFSSDLASNVRAEKACYLQPKSKIFPTVDSLIYNPTPLMEGFRQLLLLQITSASTHKVNVKGLQMLQRKLVPNSAELSSLRPTKNKKWALIFVVPDKKADEFIRGSKQKLNGKTEDYNIWYSKSCQFVLRLKEDDVLGPNIPLDR